MPWIDIVIAITFSFLHDSRRSFRLLFQAYCCYLFPVCTELFSSSYTLPSLSLSLYGVVGNPTPCFSHYGVVCTELFFFFLTLPSFSHYMGSGRLRLRGGFSRWRRSGRGLKEVHCFSIFLLKGLCPHAGSSNSSFFAVLLKIRVKNLQAS